MPKPDKKRPNRRTVTVNLSPNLQYITLLEDWEKYIDAAKKRAEEENLIDPIVRFDVDTNQGYYGNETHVTLLIQATRDETDEEYDIRVADEQERGRANREYEYKQYLRLKEKFDKNENTKNKAS